MVPTARQRDRREPFSLVVTGEAESWLPAVRRIVGPRWLRPYHASDQRDLLEVVQSGRADAAVLDEEAMWDVSVLQLLRMIRRVNAVLPVAIVTRHTDRRWLEDALRLAAFSVMTKPLQLEALLWQIHRMMARIDEAIRREAEGS